jgi:hypothetical protein
MRVHELSLCFAVASRRFLIVTLVCDQHPVVAHSIVVDLVVSVYLADLLRVNNSTLFEQIPVYCILRLINGGIERG